MTTTYININGDVRDASSLTVPADRTFRGAWSFDGDAVEVDMTAARDIHKENLRVERKPRMEALDVDFMQALEAGTSTTQIATDKQTLRDITDDARIASAADPDALKALDLATLLGE
jgi:ADP-ribose pyrophosphatase YjhB (NUDIX family)